MLHTLNVTQTFTLYSGSYHDLIEYTTDPELIYEKWGNIVDIVIDGGFGNNVPSTIVELSDGEITILREGKGSIDDL